MAEEMVAGNAVRLVSDDFKHSGKIDMFAGRVSFSVFDNGPSRSAPIIKVLWSHTALVEFRVILKKIISEIDAQPITQDLLSWNKDLKTHEFRSKITVGRDAEKCIYFDASGDKHKETVRIYLVTDVGRRINGMELPKQRLTESGAEAIYELLRILMDSAIRSPSRPANGGPITTTQVGTAPQTNVGTDVPF